MTQPVYVIFEGIDGSGKSTQAQRLGHAAERRGITPIHLSEPSCGPYGLEIRRRIANGTLRSRAEQRSLFTRDRRDHVECKVTPLLAFVRQHPGFMIIQSRSVFSAAAYQATSDDPADLAAIIKEQQAFAPKPDCTLILDIPVALALERLSEAGRGDALETQENLARARSRYWHLAQTDSQHTIWIDGCGDPERVADRVSAAIFGG